MFSTVGVVHGWVQKVDFQPDVIQIPNYIVIDEVVIRINDLQYWLSAGADPETNQLLHVRLFIATTTALTEIFFRGHRGKHDVETAESWLHALARWHNLLTKHHSIRN
jgi:transposase-like protein